VSWRYLGVDDSGTTNARVCGYESMDGIDTVTPSYSLFPTEAQRTGGGYVWKNNGVGPRPWSLFTDGRMIYFFCDPNGNAGWMGGFVFGEGVSYLSPDPFNSLLHSSYIINTQFGFGPLTNGSGADSAHYLARSYSQVMGAVTGYRYSHGRTSYMGDTGQAYPAPCGSAFHAWPVEYWESTTVARGLLPGLWNPIHDSEPSHGTQITDIPQLPGRTLVVQALNTARFAFDITGPWR